MTVAALVADGALGSGRCVYAANVAEAGRGDTRSGAPARKLAEEFTAEADRQRLRRHAEDLETQATELERRAAAETRKSA